MLANTDNLRKSPVRLSNKEKYAVYKFAIENHGVVQLGEDYEFRVPAIRIAKEINMLSKPLVSKKITSHHVFQSVAEIVEWQRFLDKVPAVPQETVELEQLRIDLKKAKLERDESRVLASNLETELNELKRANLNWPTLIKDQKDRLDKIKAILAA